MDFITNFTELVADRPNITAEAYYLPNVTTAFLQMVAIPKIIPTGAPCRPNVTVAAATAQRSPQRPLTVRTLPHRQIAYRPKVNPHDSYHQNVSTDMSVFSHLIYTKYLILLNTKRKLPKKVQCAHVLPKKGTFWGQVKTDPIDKPLLWLVRR